MWPEQVPSSSSLRLPPRAHSEVHVLLGPGIFSWGYQTLFFSLLQKVTKDQDKEKRLLLRIWIVLTNSLFGFFCLAQNTCKMQKKKKKKSQLSWAFISSSHEAHSDLYHCSSISWCAWMRHCDADCMVSTKDTMIVIIVCIIRLRVDLRLWIMTHTERERERLEAFCELFWPYYCRIAERHFTMNLMKWSCVR